MKCKNILAEGFSNFYKQYELEMSNDKFVLLQTVKSKTETVTEEMLDEDLKEDELSDNEGPPTVPEMEQEEIQPSNVSNKYVL